MSDVRQLTASVSIERRVDEATATRFWRLYVATFGDLATKAVARQLLREDEFMEEMYDERVDKYVARDGTGEVVAMCTLTNHLETVPWISADFFAHHYPDHTARQAVYYLGFILVAHEYRRSHLFLDMVRQVTETIVDERGMCAYDICAHNVEVLGLADVIASLLQGVADIDINTVDTQRYYTAVAMGPRRMPEMRPRPRGET